MNKTTEALKLANEALGWTDEWRPVGLHSKALAAIREVLAGDNMSPTEPANMNLNCKSVQARLATSWGYVKAEQAECKECGAKQAQIDRLMLEYCPDEMTPEQMQEWRNNQRPAEQVEQEPVATDLMDMLRLIETIKYLRGIAERGLGREIREDETIEQFVLGYVKQLESTQPVKQEPVAWISAKESFCGFPKLLFSEKYKDGYKPVYLTPPSVEAAIEATKEKAAKVADLAMLGADRELTKSVLKAIRSMK